MAHTLLDVVPKITITLNNGCDTELSKVGHVAAYGNRHVMTFRFMIDTATMEFHALDSDRYRSLSICIGKSVITPHGVSTVSLFDCRTITALEIDSAILGDGSIIGERKRAVELHLHHHAVKSLKKLGIDAILTIKYRDNKWYIKEVSVSIPDGIGADITYCMRTHTNQLFEYVK